MLDECYLEDDDGKYRRFGAVVDWVRVADSFGANSHQSIVITDHCGMTVHVVVRGQKTLVMDMDKGLRYLRCYPEMLGILIAGDETNYFSHLDTSWYEEEKPKLHGLQTQLVMAILKAAKCSGQHISFW